MGNQCSNTCAGDSEESSKLEEVSNHNQRKIIQEISEENREFTLGVQPTSPKISKPEIKIIEFNGQQIESPSNATLTTTQATISQRFIIPNNRSLREKVELHAAIVLQTAARCFIAYGELQQKRILREKYDSLTNYFCRSELFETLSKDKPYNKDEAVEHRKQYKYSNGAKYTGMWKGGFRHGKGTIIWKDGTSYQGDWDLGFAHGRGTFIDKLGNIYEGGFYMNMAHGPNGIFTNTLGDMYEGSWKLDKKHGKGKEIWVSDQSTYEGEYVQGERQGFGVYRVK